MVTSLTCISRIHQFDYNTESSSFVSHKLLQLVKIPPCYHAVKMFVPCLSLSSNILKLFHANYSAIVPFGFFYKLCRKSKQFSNFCVAKFAQFDGITSIFFNRYVEDVVTSIRKTLACFFKSKICRRSGNKFAANSFSIDVEYCLPRKELKQLKMERGFLPPLKGWVSTSSNE
jgi:hypothetical protein